MGNCIVAQSAACGGKSAIDDARAVANTLGIDYHVVDFVDEFQKSVKDYFVDEYMHGRTPNPCIVCNRKVKWEALLFQMRILGADFIATGHYAQIKKLSNGRFSIANSITAQKDQTYALYNLTQEQLAHTLMPVGAYEKTEIREIAVKIGLNIANKPDSQDICFIPDKDYGAYIRSAVGEKLPGPGDFVLTDGTVVGRHNGITNYTVGQRKHLGIALGKPVFVKKIDVSKNQVVLADNDDVFTNELEFDQVNCMAVAEFKENDEFVAKIRYSDPGAVCRVKSVSTDSICLEFPQKVRAVTPGQAVVLYRENCVAGGGIIC